MMNFNQLEAVVPNMMLIIGDDNAIIALGGNFEYLWRYRDFKGRGLGGWWEVLNSVSR
jgi:hypothetical protein